MENRYSATDFQQPTSHSSNRRQTVFNLPTRDSPFQSYIDFQTNACAQPVHDNIPYFDAAFAGVEKGYRHRFRHLLVDLEAYHSLCETLDFLCVDVLAGSSLDQIINSLKVGKGNYELEYKYSVFVKGNKTTARDVSFLFVYQCSGATLQTSTGIA